MGSKRQLTITGLLAEYSESTPVSTSELSFTDSYESPPPVPRYKAYALHCWGEPERAPPRALQRLRSLSHVNWGEPERAPPRALQRLRSLSHNWRAGASQPSRTAGPRCRDIYIYIYIVRRRRAPGVYDVNIP